MQILQTIRPPGIKDAGLPVLARRLAVSVGQSALGEEVAETRESPLVLNVVEEREPEDLADLWDGPKELEADPVVFEHRLAEEEPVIRSTLHSPFPFPHSRECHRPPPLKRLVVRRMKREEE